MDNISENESVLHKKAYSCVCLYAIILLILWILSFTPIFETSIIKNIPLLISLVVLGILLIILHFKNNDIVKYLIATVTILSAASIYTIHQNATILLFAFPLFLAQLYNNRRLLIFTDIFIVISLLLAAMISSVFYDNEGLNINGFMNMLKLFGVGFIQVLVLLITSTIVFDRTMGLISTNQSSSNLAKTREKTLDDILNKSQRLATVDNLYDLHINMKESIMDLLSYYTEKPEENIFHMGMISNNVCHVLDDITRPIKKDLKEGKIIINCKDFDYLLNIYDDNSEPVFIFDNYILVKLFDDSTFSKELDLNSVPKLNYFILVETDFKFIDHSFESSLKMLQKTMESAMNNLFLRFTLQSSQKEMIYAIAQVSESRSHQTGKHILRVAEYMKVLCIAAGYSENDANKISVASMLHDVGKLYIPSEILEKNGKLTDEEFEIIKQHVTLGSKLIDKCQGDVMAYARTMIYEHHERYDGLGYNKLKPSETSFPSRLLAVADVFDALISKRSYKAEWDPKEAYNLIVKESGTHFDPECVKIFKKCFLELVYIHKNHSD